MRQPTVREIEHAKSAALARLHREFPRFRDEHEDFVQSAMVDAMRTLKRESGFAALVEVRARGYALRRANKSRREPTAVDAATDAASPFASGKRPLPKTKLGTLELERLGRFYQHEGGRLASFAASGLLFKAEFISAHFACLGRLIQSSLGSTPPENFVEELTDFANRTARLSPTGDASWTESDETGQLRIEGQTRSGTKPGRRRGQLAGFPLCGETEFRQKRKDVGRLIAAHALELCGFTSREVHDRNRRVARKWSATRAVWVRKLQEARAAEPAPGAAGGEIPEDQVPSRHPAFR